MGLAACGAVHWLSRFKDLLLSPRNLLRRSAIKLFKFYWSINLNAHDTFGSNCLSACKHCLVSGSLLHNLKLLSSLKVFGKIIDQSPSADKASKYSSKSEDEAVRYNSNTMLLLSSCYCGTLWCERMKLSLMKIRRVAMKPILASSEKTWRR